MPQNTTNYSEQIDAIMHKLLDNVRGYLESEPVTEAKAKLTALLQQVERDSRINEHNLTRRHYHPDNEPARFESFLNDRLQQLQSKQEGE